MEITFSEERKKGQGRMRYRDYRFRSDPFSNGYIVITVLLYSSSILMNVVNASIHEYKNESFTRRANSYFFHGGSEGLYASKVHVEAENSASSDEKPVNGRSFIR